MIGSPDLAKIYKAFVETLAELDEGLDTENRNITRLIFSEFAASKNPAITDLCLTNLQDSMYLGYRTETCQVMLFDYHGFKYPKDKDVLLMFLQAWDNMRYEDVKDLYTSNLKHSDYDIAKASADALKNLAGKDYEKQITAPKYRTDFDWDFIDKLNDKKYATVKTNQGDIKIELYPGLTPFTVQNFVKLSEKGYYNNTIFHRVVPNFVIQGGDPTGTGYGGPGYSIRSEFSPVAFDAYTVGMASSGKDTEGSQFFITHSPQPHLDGKYPLFGKVIEGFDVVDRIQAGDRIESVSFSPKP
jgi:cyclophilin family peptidyl-prolyl cis-trans isomerase